MAQLAIKGHADRCDEVIKILELLGGENSNHNAGNYINSIYFINSFGYIEATSNLRKMLDFTVLTLDEVEALMPYKIGDKVLHEGEMYEITGVAWHRYYDKIVYDAKGEKNKLLLFDPNKFTSVMNNEEFQNKLLKIYPDGKTGRIQLIPHEDYEIKEINGDFVIIKKLPKYPTAFVECSEVLGVMYDDYVCGYKGVLLRRLQQLLICRDTYWKIAGEQMGLDKPWEPDWANEIEIYYTISYDGVNIKCYNDTDVYSKLAFPTTEMRDAFYDNFKNLIEDCKELL